MAGECGTVTHTVSHPISLNRRLLLLETRGVAGLWDELLERVLKPALLSHFFGQARDSRLQDL